MREAAATARGKRSVMNHNVSVVNHETELFNNHSDSPRVVPSADFLREVLRRAIHQKSQWVRLFVLGPFPGPGDPPPRGVIHQKHRFDRDNWGEDKGEQV